MTVELSSTQHKEIIMKCNHSGCYAFLHPADALYPELAVMETALGRKVTEDDIDNFAFHCVHGPGSSRASAVHFLHTAYQGKPLLTPPKTQKTPAPATKPSKEVVEARALAMRFRFSVSVDGAFKASKRSRAKGTKLEKELATQRMIEAGERARAARAAAQQVASVEAA